MGRTREALKRAEDQYNELQNRTLHEVFSKEPGSKQWRAFVRKNIKCYADLKNKLRVRNIGGSTKSVLFIKTFKQGESINYAIKFATSLAEDLRIKVLLIDLNIGCLDHREAFEIDRKLFLSELFVDENKAIPPRKVGPGNLYRTQWGGNHSSLVEAFKSENFDLFRKRMCEKFDFIVMNVPEVASFRECRLLCSKVDAVVLILKSDKIADRIDVNAKKYFQNSADKVLGFIIVNPRTYQYKFLKFASIALMSCLIFTFGFLIGNDRLNVFPNIKNVQKSLVKSTRRVQPKHKSNVNVYYDIDHNSAAEKKVAIEQIQESPEEVNPTKDMAEEKFSTTRETVPSTVEKPIAKTGDRSDENNEVGKKRKRVVIVRRGETLFRIIYRNYGTYNADIAHLVLRENPKILSPSRIFVGQSIKLPEVDIETMKPLRQYRSTGKHSP